MWSLCSTSTKNSMFIGKGQDKERGSQLWEGKCGRNEGKRRRAVFVRLAGHIPLSAGQSLELPSSSWHRRERHLHKWVLVSLF